MCLRDSNDALCFPTEIKNHLWQMRHNSVSNEIRNVVPSRSAVWKGKSWPK